MINNASIFEYDNLKTIKQKGISIFLQINAYDFIKPFLKIYLKIKTHIINIIDQRVLNLTPHFLSYTISKSALWTLLEPCIGTSPKIKVNAIGPGPVIKSKFQTEKEFLNQCKTRC